MLFCAETVQNYSFTVLHLFPIYIYINYIQYILHTYATIALIFSEGSDRIIKPLKKFLHPLSRGNTVHQLKARPAWVYINLCHLQAVRF